MARRRVLVVEDEATIREMLALILDAEGYEVDLAAEGEEALAAIERTRPDIILLDMKMPGVDGYAFAKRYNASDGPKAPIIVITAARSAVEAAAEVQACASLGKPFGVDQLLEAVTDCLARAAPPA